jgi:hypothetical protein
MRFSDEDCSRFSPMACARADAAGTLARGYLSADLSADELATSLRRACDKLAAEPLQLIYSAAA